MTKEDEGHYADKHGQDQEINPDIAELVRKKSSNNKISCAAAFKIAEDLNKTPAEVGAILDFLEVKITKCQLGIFGYDKDVNVLKFLKLVPDPLKKAILEVLTDGKLQCGDAWKTAEKMGIGKMDVTSACNALGVKISTCQLGAF